MNFTTTIDNNVYKKQYNGKEVDTYKFLLMDGTVTRNNYKYRVNGIDLEGFLKNPVVLKNHDSSEAVGSVVEIERLNGKMFGYVYISNEEQKLKNKIEEAVYRAASITVMPKKTTPFKNIVNVDESELLEVSIVTIPNNKNTVKNKHEVNMEQEEMQKQLENQKAELDKLQNSISDKEKEMETLKNSLNDYNKSEDFTELKNSYEEFVKKHDSQQEEIKKLKNQIEGLSKKQKPISIDVKDVKSTPWGDIAIANFMAKEQDIKPIQYMKNQVENGGEYEKQRWIKALANYVQTSETPYEVLHNSYNLGSIADGSTLTDPNNALPVQEILRRENTILNLSGIRRIPFVQGRATFPRQSAKGTAAAYQSDGTDTPTNVESSFEQVELYVKEVAGEIYIQNHMLRYGNPAISSFLQDLLIKDILDKAEDFMLTGTGASGQPRGLLVHPDIETSAATASASNVEVDADIRTMRKKLSDNNAGENLAFLMRNNTKIAIEGKFTSDGGQMFYSQQLMSNNQLHTYPVTTSNAMPSGGDSVVLLLDPSTIVMGMTNGVQVTSSEHIKIREDQTYIKGILGLDVNYINPGAVYKLTEADEWE